MFKFVLNKLILSCAVILVLIGCNTLKTLSGLGESPRQEYVNSLTRSNLVTTSMAKTWLAAGDPARHVTTLFL